MNTGGFLFQAFVYLAAGVAAVPVAKRLGLGSVLGYLIAGAIIGPFGLACVNSAAEAGVMHVAEFGVVMMLFLVGLELQPRLLWRMRGQLFGLGGLQVGLTALAFLGGGVALGVDWRVALAAGLILAMSSTAIVLQTLQERKLLRSPAGEASFAVLLFQDISVIPILALLPLLAMVPETGGATPAAAHGSLIAALPGWAQAAVVLVTIAGIVFAGRHVVNPIFRIIARTNLRELFTAAALLLVVTIALVMQMVGLSAALGTFIAGVVLADSEYRHELESDIEPFKGLLLGLFFISVGAGIDFHLLAARPLAVLGVLVAIIAVKAAVLYALGKWFGLVSRERWLLALGLAQGGEFAFVLLSLVVDKHVIPAEEASLLVVAVALSMAVAPLLFVIEERWVRPRHTPRTPERPPDAIPESDNPVIIAGFGRFGHVIGRLLRANGIGTTVLDLDPEQVELLGRLGIKVFYGDATRPDLLHAAGAAKARLFINAIDDEEKSVAAVDMVRKHFPHLQILTRAVGRVHAYEFQSRGVDRFYRETLGSSLELAVDALVLLGREPEQARQAAARFRAHDDRTMRELAQYWEDDDRYFMEARKHIDAFEHMLRADQPAPTEKPPV